MIYLIGVPDHSIQCLTATWPPIGKVNDILEIGEKRLVVCRTELQFEKYQLPFQKYLEKKIKYDQTLSCIFEEWPWVLYIKEPVSSTAQNLINGRRYVQIDLFEREGKNRDERNSIRESHWLKKIKNFFPPVSNNGNALIILGDYHLISFQSKLCNEGYNKLKAVGKEELIKELDEYLA